MKHLDSAHRCARYGVDNGMRGSTNRGSLSDPRTRLPACQSQKHYQFSRFREWYVSTSYPSSSYERIGCTAKEYEKQ